MEESAIDYNEEIRRMEQEANEQLITLNQELGIEHIVENIFWEDICNRCDDLQIHDVVIEDQPISSDQLLLIDLKSFRFENKSRLILTSPEHKFPYLRDSSIKITTMATENLIQKGLYIHSTFNMDNPSELTEEGKGIITFTPFEKGKKLFAFFVLKKLESTQRICSCIFHMGECKTTDSIVSIPFISPSNIRDLDGELTEIDKIVLKNSSAKFRKIADNMIHVKDALVEIGEQIRNTVDPNYIKKLLYLNHKICFPDTPISEEE